MQGLVYLDSKKGTCTIWPLEAPSPAKLPAAIVGDDIWKSSLQARLGVSSRPKPSPLKHLTCSKDSSLAFGTWRHNTLSHASAMRILSRLISAGRCP